MLSDIIHVNKKDDKKIFIIDASRHSKRVRREQLLNILKKNGYLNYTSKHSYIQFTELSPIDKTAIKNSLKQFYINKYKNINIQKITLQPMHYLNELPESYTVHFPKNAHLSRKGVLYIKTSNNKKIFFSYQITARVDVLVARTDIKKDSELSNINTKKNSIILNKFRAMPIESLHVKQYQSKHNLRKGNVITKRDVLGLYLIRRGSNINVKLENAGINIFFSAKALQNGRIADTISVMQKNGKKIKVQVTGKNKAEMK